MDKWKEKLKILESNKQWDEAIDFMKEVIGQNPNDTDAYLSMNYLLMNLLVEENYDDAKFPYYARLLKKYFNESYAKFSENPEYLFFIGIIAVMSEWYFDIESEDVKTMLQKAIALEPENMLYKWTYYSDLDRKDPKNKILRLKYAKSIINDESIKKILLSKGSLGEYILEISTNWAQKIIEDNPNYS